MRTSTVPVVGACKGRAGLRHGQRGPTGVAQENFSGNAALFVDAMSWAHRRGVAQAHGMRSAMALANAERPMT